MKEIKSDKVNIKKVFEEWYTVPSYQRHYVWEEDHIIALLEDIRDNYIERKDEEYFLGSYIIQKKGGNNDLLDGQQRITTLFLLFAFLRDYERTEIKLRGLFQNFIYQEENPLTDTKERVRLSYEIRGNVKEFIQEYVIRPGSITNEWKHIESLATNTKENETIQHICRALVCFKSFFDDNEQIEIQKYIVFITTNMVMINISADTLEDAFRMFSIMNDRGVKLSNSDILKSSNLELIKDPQQMEKYAREWEQLQLDLGSDFDRFLSHVRTLFVKTKAKLGMLDEYNKNIFKAGLLEQGKPFFDTIREYYKIYNRVIQLDDNDDMAYCNFIHVLNSSNLTTDWMPVVMCYYKRFKGNGLFNFTQKLIYKAVGDMVCGESPTKRIENMNKVMPIIESAQNYNDVITLNPEAFTFNKDIFLNNIQTDIYGRTYAKTILLLLEYKYQDNSLPHSYNMVSIEHILPQNPAENSAWYIDYTEDERRESVHKIGNLCIIGRKKNTSLGNLDYQDKRKRYFEKNIGNFARTLKIYNDYSNHWLPSDLRQNMNNTIKDIRDMFDV